MVFKGIVRQGCRLSKERARCVAVMKFSIVNDKAGFGSNLDGQCNCSSGSTNVSGIPSVERSKRLEDEMVEIVRVGAARLKKKKIVRRIFEFQFRDN